MTLILWDYGNKLKWLGLRMLIHWTVSLYRRLFIFCVFLFFSVCSILFRFFKVRFTCWIWLSCTSWFFLLVWLSHSQYSSTGWIVCLECCVLKRENSIALRILNGSIYSIWQWWLQCEMSWMTFVFGGGSWSHCSHCWPGTHCVDWLALNLEDVPPCLARLFL